jgi:4-amino-4-deoxy-L-arabinose transferase-like glycosyltransferase
MRPGSDARRRHDAPAMSGPVPVHPPPSPAEHPRTPARGRSRQKASTGALALVLVYVAAMAWVAQHRVVGDYLKETDFYHLYAPDADRIRSGQLPANTFNTGPAYPLLLALAFPLTADNFTAGKFISLAAAGVAALAAFQLFRGLFGDRAGFLGLLFLLVSADFARFSVQATTDMPFLASAVLAMLAISRAISRGGWMWGVAGSLGGLAYLVRYNGLFLVPTGVYGVLTSGRWSAPRLRNLALLLLGVLIVVSPWLLLSTRLHGTPFFNRTHAMMAIAAYGLRRDLDGVYDAAERFQSIGDVVRHDPLRFFGQYARNLTTTVANTLAVPLAVLPLGLLAVTGAIQVATRRADRRARPFLVSLALFVLVVALVHWESRYVLYLGVGCAGLAGYAIVSLTQEAQKRRRLTLRQARVLLGLLVLAVLAPALVRTPLRVAEMLQRQPVELLIAAEKLRHLAGPGARIMGRKPHLAYLAGGEWVFLPEVASLDALEEALCGLSAAYLVYDDSARKLRRELSSLEDPYSPVPWLRAVHVNHAAPLIVYAVGLDGRCPTPGRNTVYEPVPQHER